MMVGKTYYRSFVRPDYWVVSRKCRNGTVETNLLLINRGVDERSRLRVLVP